MRARASFQSSTCTSDESPFPRVYDANKKECVDFKSCMSTHEPSSDLAAILRIAVEYTRNESQLFAKSLLFYDENNFDVVEDDHKR